MTDVCELWCVRAQDRKAETSQLMAMIHEERLEAEAALAAIIPEEEQAQASDWPRVHAQHREQTAQPLSHALCVVCVHASLCSMCARPSV